MRNWLLRSTTWNVRKRAWRMNMLSVSFKKNVHCNYSKKESKLRSITKSWWSSTILLENEKKFRKKWSALTKSIYFNKLIQIIWGKKHISRCSCLESLEHSWLSANKFMILLGSISLTRKKMSLRSSWLNFVQNLISKLHKNGAQQRLPRSERMMICQFIFLSLSYHWLVSIAIFWYIREQIIQEMEAEKINQDITLQ